ncbi:MAG: rod shape-determining protein MreC [Oscillospiraceae bacterium]|nr:rod shape-determining protein MreC [Oscillospiraceae bacterium]
MKRSSHHKGIWTVVIAALLALGLLAGSLASGRNLLAAGLEVVATPLRSGFSSLAGWVEGVYSYAFEYGQLVEENEALRQQVAELEEAAREGQEAEEENEQLRDLLGLKEKRADFDFEAATVTARGSSNWSSTLTLNKGSQDGVEVNDCVVDQYGYLVGVVTETGYNWCIVRTVIDIDLELGGTVSGTDTTGILEGDFSLMGQGQLKLSYLDGDTELETGVQVLTSGASGIYPSGLVVGVVEQVLDDASGMSRYAVVTPSADLDSVRQVFIIKDFDIQE